MTQPVSLSPRRFVAIAALLACLTVATAGPSAQNWPSAAGLESVRAYIHDAWPRLTRSNADIAQAAKDPKIPHRAGEPWPVYVAATDAVSRVRDELRRTLGAPSFASIDVRPLPPDPLSLREHGLLYLPRPYVVPGGRFNEMYGWDSYFIEIGLLEDGEVELAGDVVENFLYEVHHFGKVLNANRTYYLTRSQPP